MQAPQLKRGLFGYRASSVRLLLADRDKMFLRASENARSAEALVVELQSEIESVKAEAAARAERVESLTAEVAERAAEVAERAEKLRAAEAEAADLRMDRDATREELARSAVSVERFTHELEAARGELTEAQELVRVADAQVARHAGDLAVLRQELGAARRDFLVQNQRARSAENRVEELESELVSTRDGLASELAATRNELEAQLISTRDQMEAELASTRDSLESALASANRDLEEARAAAAEARAALDVPSTAEELASVVESAEQALGRVLDAARTRAEIELREAERARRDIWEQVQRMAEWRERLTPLVGAVRASIDETRQRASQIGDGVQEAVHPVTRAIEVLGDRLATLAELSGPPSSADPSSEPWFRVIELEEEEASSQEMPAHSDWG